MTLPAGLSQAKPFRPVSLRFSLPVKPVFQLTQWVRPEASSSDALILAWERRKAAYHAKKVEQRARVDRYLAGRADRRNVGMPLASDN